MAPKIILILILMLSGFSFSCSSIDAAWYSHPGNKFYYKNKKLSVPTARLQLGDYGHEIWSESNRYVTHTGPTCLVPFYPQEWPILNNQDLRLNWRISFRQGINDKSSAVLPRNSLEILTANGKRIMPFSISTFRRLPNGNRSMLKYINPIPEKIIVYDKLEMVIWYPKIYYAKEKWYQIKPELLVNGKTAMTPIVRFIPKRDHDYHPFRFPFAYAPIR